MSMAIRDMFTTCLLAWFHLYGALLLTVQIYPCTVCIGTLVPIVLFLVACYMRIPQPDPQVVEEIIGTDPRHGKKDGKFFMCSVAHRGAGLDAPENSMSAFRECARQGCLAVEFDLMLTKDEVPIVFHDDTIDRLTGHHGVVKDMTWAELQKLDISATHHLHERYKGEKICLVEDAVKLCLDLDLRMFLDIKDYSSKMTQVILELYQKYPKLYQRAFVSSFNPFIIYQIRRVNPSICASIAFRPYYFSHGIYSSDKGPSNSKPVGFTQLLLCRIIDTLHVWFFERLTYHIIGVSAVLLISDVVSLETLRRWRNRNIRVIVWSANQPVEKKYFHKVCKITYMTDTMIGEAEIISQTH